jgi:hypothetical protein
VKKFFSVLLFILFTQCSPQVQPPDPESMKPSWLKTTPYHEGYYTGIGHSVKSGSNNYVQAAKKSALDDLVSQIRVSVSSTSILNQIEIDKKLSEQYEQIIQTTAADEIEEFELVDAWEDEVNYWVYYRLSISRYRQIKEEQRTNATILASDFLQKGKEAERMDQRLQALSFYFQALRSIEKYLGEPLKTTVEGKEILLGNEIYASLQMLLNKIKIYVEPTEVFVNRRVNQTQTTLTAASEFSDLKKPAAGIPLFATFEKGSGELHPTYITNTQGSAKILINKIGSKELDQTIEVSVDIDALSGSAQSPIYTLVTKSLSLPSANVVLRVQRPLVYLTAEEKSFGRDKSNYQITSRLKNLLVNNGFEFTDNRGSADLWIEVKSDAEKGSVTGSIYVTYLTSVIKVLTVKEGKEIYATTLDRVKGYGLDYDKSSVDAYNKAIEALEKERIDDLLNTVLQ